MEKKLQVFIVYSHDLDGLQDEIYNFCKDLNAIIKDVRINHHKEIDEEFLKCYPEKNMFYYATILYYDHEQ
jgi:hypothetical protein